MLNRSLHYLFIDCGEPLVGSNDSPIIVDSSITASSTDIVMGNINEARLGENDGWIPEKTDKHPYLEFDLENFYLICGFEVQGCKKSWVTRYRVQISPEKDFWDTWNYIKVITTTTTTTTTTKTTTCKCND